jgi:hypothetical protein
VEARRFAVTPVGATHKLESFGAYMAVLSLGVVNSLTLILANKQRELVLTTDHVNYHFLKHLNPWSLCPSC